jgi:MraZ protein
VDDSSAKTVPIEPPRGIFQARVDEKGRLKLPADFKEYVISFGDRKVFVTSLDLSTARIYPNSLWKDNQKVFEEFQDDPDAAEDVAFTAADMGGDCVMDDQGRVLVPQELRRLLEIENQPVWLQCFQGVIHIYSKAVYEERKRRAGERLQDKVRTLRQKGLK